MQLPAAIVRADIGVGEKGQHHRRLLQVRRDILRPLAAHLDAAVIPHAAARRLQPRRDLHDRRGVGMGIAEKHIGLCPLKGDYSIQGRFTSVCSDASV